MKILNIDLGDFHKYIIDLVTPGSNYKHNLDLANKYGVSHYEFAFLPMEVKQNFHYYYSNIEISQMGKQDYKNYLREEEAFMKRYRAYKLEECIVKPLKEYEKDVRNESIK